MVSDNSDENKDLRPAEQLLAAWLEAQAKRNALAEWLMENSNTTRFPSKRL